MTYYYKKRRQSGLERSDVANLLGIDYKRYESIERGIVKMPKNLIDKFNEIVNRDKGENKIQQLNREQVVEEFWNEIKGNRQKLLEKMKEFNIATYKELAILLGYKEGSTISNYINGNIPCSYDFKNKLYSFFENELNIQEPKTKVINKPISKTTKEEKELIEWYEKFDVKAWVTEKGMSIKECGRVIGMPETTFYYLANKKFKSDRGPSLVNVEKVKNFIENYSVTNNVVTLTPEEHREEKTPIDEKIKQLETQLQYNYELETGLSVEPSNKEKLITKYSDKLDAMNKEEEYLLGNLRNIEIQLFTLRSEKAIYEQFIDEIKEV